MATRKHLGLPFVLTISICTAVVSVRLCLCHPVTVTSHQTTIDEISHQGASTKATDADDFWTLSTDTRPLNKSDPENDRETSCRLKTIDPLMFSRIRQAVEVDKINLIEYKLYFRNYSYNPLETNVSIHHNAGTWARVSTQHGQTLLSLAFNYGILSLMTLTLGTELMHIELADQPTGCFEHLEEDRKIELVQQLLMRDFRENGSISLDGTERICHEIITNQSGFAKFTDWCCYVDSISGKEICDGSYANEWLQFLYVLLSAVRFGVLFFGPLMFFSAVGSLTREEFPYTVKPREPLIRRMMIIDNDTNFQKKSDHDLSKLKNELDKKNIQPLDDIKVALDFHEKRVLDMPKLNKSIGKDTKVLDPQTKKVFDPPKLNESKKKLGMIPPGKPFWAKIIEYHITVNHKNLITEDNVPIGLWKTIIKYLFFCKLDSVGPFAECCEADMLCSCTNTLNTHHKQQTSTSSPESTDANSRRPFKNSAGSQSDKTKVEWIKFWRKVGLGLIVLLFPTPYYIRLILFYFFEYDEVMSRKKAIDRMGLKESFENSLVQYLLPTHPLLICMYIVYGVMTIALGYMARRTEEGSFRKIIIGAFTDLKTLLRIDVLQMMVSNVIWPFKKFGVVGLLVIFIYWPIVLPITFTVCLFYCLPTIYLTIRMLFYSRRAFLEKDQKRSKRRNRVRRQVDNSLTKVEDGSEEKYRVTKKSDDSFQVFNMDKVFERLCGVNNKGQENNIEQVDESKIRDRQKESYVKEEAEGLNKQKNNQSAHTSFATDQSKICNWRRVLEHVFASTLCVTALYSVSIIMSECIGCLVEIMVFTMMGIIVNAGTLLKYIALVILVVVYSYDSFNSVEKKYLKLNRAIFNEVIGRIKDLEDVTSLLSDQQENCGFVSQELSKQAKRKPDDLTNDSPNQWLIHNLVLFIDNEDKPRIPRKLFEDVCEIRVAGVPGPVYLGLLFALKQFLKIAVFVAFIFLVILSFGNVYGLTHTNQMIAALAGGSLPLIMRTVMEPKKTDVELGTVSFKIKLDEIIKKQNEKWPIHDFSFKLLDPDKDKLNDVELIRESDESTIKPKEKKYKDILIILPVET